MTTDASSLNPQRSVLGAAKAQPSFARFLVVLIALGCASASRPVNVVRSTAATPVDDSQIEGRDFAFEVHGEQLSLNRDGLLRRGSRALQLPMSDMYLESLEFLPYKESLILFYGLSDGEGGSSRYASVSLEHMEVVYWQDIAGFNLGGVVLEGSYAYLSAIGFVGCLDVESSEFVWTHGALYHRHHFEGFKEAVVYPDRVEFPVFNDKSNRRVIVDKRTGGMVIKR